MTNIYLYKHVCLVKLSKFDRNLSLKRVFKLILLYSCYALVLLLLSFAFWLYELPWKRLVLSSASDPMAPMATIG